VIGWASILADFAGALLIIVLSQKLGDSNYVRTRKFAEPALPEDEGWSAALCLQAAPAGFARIPARRLVCGIYLYEHERMETDILQNMITAAGANDLVTATDQVGNFGNLSGARAVTLQHILTSLSSTAGDAAFIRATLRIPQRAVERRWTQVLLAGSVVLPVFVLLELRFGLVAGGVADIGGLMVTSRSSRCSSAFFATPAP